MDAKNHAHTDSYWAPVEGCQITSRSADAVKSQAGEDVIEQSIQFTDVYRMMIRPLSGGLESIARLFYLPYFPFLSTTGGGAVGSGA